MPADNRIADCSSLNWEEFFGSSNSDLLPCLLSVYDSIAAARKLEQNDALRLEKSTQARTDLAETHVVSPEKSQAQVTRIAASSLECRVEEKCEGNRSSCELSTWCSVQEFHESASSFKADSSSSCTYAASISSRSSACSHGSSSASENSSIGHSDSNRVRTNRLVRTRAHAGNNDFDDLVSNVDDVEDKGGGCAVDVAVRENAKLLQPMLKTSYTTTSQYSEDSGIYSSLIRSESLHERSWYYAEGEDVSYMNRVILEIIESEFVYVNDLQQIITGYLDEWRNDNECSLSMEQINDLFGNIKEIYHFNRCFLWELEQCGQDSVKIARCFVKNNSNFSIYAAYCTHYPKSISILTELMRQDKTAHFFRDRQIRLQHTLPLGSYLLKPVQRILKYHLLLENMVKHASPEMIGYNDITVALSTMTGIAHHINTMKRRHEHAVRVQEVQSLLTSWQGLDLTTFGELYAEGSFRISGAKAFRHIFLFEHMLLVTKKKEGGILNYKTHILCSNLMLVECIPKEPLSFQIIPFDNPRMQFTVHARSLEEKRHWTLELKRVILENYSVEIPSHARQLVMELGQIQNLKNVSVEKISPRRQYSTPDYLERRKIDKAKRKSTKLRLLPLFRKSDSARNYKMRSKLKKNQSLSESSIFSDNSINSDESSLNDCGLQNLSKTTDDLSQACTKMTRTLEGLSKSSTTTSSTDAHSLCESTIDSLSPELDEHTSYQQKEKLIEEIIGQLLVASQKFQKAIKEHERSVRSNRRSLGSLSPNQSADSDDEYLSDSDVPPAVLKYAKECSTAVRETVELNTSSESLSASLHVLAPTPPNIWLSQQREHLATPPKKADSLPRTFQIPEDEWRSIRPKTIASDKPSRMNNMKLFRNEESPSSWLSRKKDLIISIPNLSSTSMHPDCKFYRTSAVRMTFNKMAHTIAEKWLTKRGKSERFYKVEQEVARSNRNSKYTRRLNYDAENEAKPMAAIYKQGSSDLGARIANAREISDYADPKVLFPTITPSKKAASLLGIRACSNTSSLKNEARSELMRESWPDAVNEKEDSECSADSFYERQFEEVESQFDEAIRESSILNDDADVDKVGDIGERFRKYSQVNVNISVHKLIKIPPPVPMRPAIVRSVSNLEEGNLARLRLQASARTATILKESSLPTRGWVKQVVDRFQCANE